MLYLTLIARLTDSLFLCSSLMDESKNISQKTAKKIIKTLNTQSPSPCSIEDDKLNLVYHYIIVKGIVFMLIADLKYSKRLAFSFLDDISAEFSHRFYQSDVEQVSRPFAFIKFDNFIQQTKSQYDKRAVDDSSSASDSKISFLSRELDSVSDILKKNIHQVIQVGGRIEDSYTKSKNLVDQSQQYSERSHHLNSLHFWQVYQPWIIVFLIVLFALFMRSYFF